MMWGKDKESPLPVSTKNISQYLILNTKNIRSCTPKNRFINRPYV